MMDLPRFELKILECSTTMIVVNEKEKTAYIHRDDLADLEKDLSVLSFDDNGLHAFKIGDILEDSLYQYVLNLK